VKPLDLAKVFSDLANGPPWGSIGIILLAEARLTQARLALRLVDEIGCNLESDEFAALQVEDINPDYYAKVKKRVEEADTKEKEKPND